MNGSPFYEAERSRLSRRAGLGPLRIREDEGGLGLARLYGETNTNYWYVVKSEYFDVDQEAHAALTDDMQVRLYYTPKSRLLLSIEPKFGSDAGDKASRAGSQP